jgi:hypothetical protein
MPPQTSTPGPGRSPVSMSPITQSNVTDNKNSDIKANSIDKLNGRFGQSLNSANSDFLKR